MQCNAMQCNAIQYNTTQYNTIQCNAMQCLMWLSHLAMVSMRPADMVSKICGNAPTSLQVSHNEYKYELKIFATCFEGFSK